MTIQLLCCILYFADNSYGFAKESDFMLERFEEFTYTIYEIQRCWNRIASEGMEFYGLKGSYAVYLIAMYRRPEGITATELGALCSRDKADVSRAVAVLESKNILRKEAGSGNLYRAKLVLTEYGAAITESIVKKAVIAEEIAGAGLSEEQRTALYNSLVTISQNLKELCKTGIPQPVEDKAGAEKITGFAGQVIPENA